jgi:hypothetical protein
LELHNFYSSPNIISVINIMEDEMGGHVARTEEMRNFVPLRQTLFLKTARRVSEPNQGNGVVVSFQESVLVPETASPDTAPRELEHFHGEEPNSVQASVYIQLYIIA